MAHHEDVTVCTIPPQGYLSTAMVMMAAVDHEPHYGAYNPRHFAHTWKQFAETGVAIALGAYRADSLLVGCLFGLCSPDPITGDKYGTAFFWAVKPEYRKFGVSYKLLDDFESWVKQQGGVAVTVGVQEGPKADLQHRAHRIHGYAPDSRALMKRFD